MSDTTRPIGDKRKGGRSKRSRTSCKVRRIDSILPIAQAQTTV